MLILEVKVRKQNSNFWVHVVAKFIYWHTPSALLSMACGKHYAQKGNKREKYFYSYSHQQHKVRNHYTPVQTQMHLKHRKPVLKAFTYTCATILPKPYLQGAHLIFFAFYKRMLLLQYFSFLCTSRGDRFDHFLLAFIDQCLYLLECGIYLI